MSTAIDLIKKALYLSGCSSEINPASPELTQICFEDLTVFIEELDSIGITLGLTMPVLLTDDISEPADTTKMFESNIAVRTAPYFQKDAPPATKKLAKKQYRQLLINYAPFPLPNYPDTLPIGSGNIRGVKPRVFYSPIPE